MASGDIAMEAALPGATVLGLLCAGCKQGIGRRNEKCAALQWLAAYRCSTRCPVLKDGVCLSSSSCSMPVGMHCVRLTKRDAV